MGVSGIGSSTASVFSPEMMQQMRRNRGAQGNESSEDFASDLVSRKDEDGDGALSLDETRLDEETFSSIDADGDGFLSEEEISSDMQEKRDQMSQLSMMGQMNMMQQNMQGMGQGPGSPSDMAANLVSELDTDDDELLSQDEVEMDEEMFNSIDTNGDGFLSADEISADMESRMEQMGGQGMMPPPPPPEENEESSSATGTDDAPASASTEESGSAAASTSTEYDELDLNKDGEVSMDELLQAAMNGQTSSMSDSLSSLFGSTDSQENDFFQQSMNQRLAMKAYAAQGA